MSTITIFGLLYSQHISNFAHSIKTYSDFKLIGVNNNPKLVQGNQYYHQTKESFDEIYEVSRSGNKLVDFFSKCFKPLSLIVQCGKKSEIVQFHFISYFVLPLIILVKCFTKAKTSSFVYGSDFLGASKFKLHYLNWVFRLSDSVVCDSSMVLDHLRERYPQYNKKFECCFFGSVIIDKLLEFDDKHFSPLMKTNKKVIMCGYNGALQQQHLRIFESLKSVAPEYYWLVPMTYGGSEEYKKEIKDYLDSNHLDNTVLDSFLTEEEWINYLCSTDIFIHMQTTDAFSAALSEQLLLGHIVINGEWLPYKDFDDNNVFYFKSSFDDLTKKLQDIQVNYDQYYPELKSNKGKIEKIKGLRYCINHYWLPYFDRLAAK